MSMDWSPLRRELAIWRSAQRPLSVWWRDDDAIAPTSALNQLASLSRTSGVPVHLAVIPAHVQHGLGPWIRARTEFIPVVHGWTHANHAASGQKKAEFGAARTEAVKELTHGIAKLQALFGDRLMPMFVPPWNRMGGCFEQDLVRIGYTHVSAYGPAQPTTAGLERINTHIDPIDWRGTRGLVDSDLLIAQTVRILAARRSGEQDASEPLGYLTHHLVHDAAIWDFSSAWIAEMLHGGADVLVTKAPSQEPP